MKRTIRILYVLVAAVLVVAAIAVFQQAARIRAQREQEEARRIAEENRTEEAYLAGWSGMVEIPCIVEEGAEAESVTLPRGTLLTVRVKPVETEEGETYRLGFYEEKKLRLNDDMLVDDERFVVKESEGFVNLPTVLYEEASGAAINGYLQKRSHVNIIGFGSLLEDGSVDRYFVESDGKQGYLRSKYLSPTLEEIVDNVDEVHFGREDLYGGGNAYTLEYPDLAKGDFADNHMPKEVRCVYLNRACVQGIDAYIELANNSGINAFVLDIKESDGPSYKSPVIQRYNPGAYEYGFSEFDEYKDAVRKCKEAGIYMIGRIVTFKDDFYATDHPENVLGYRDSDQSYKLQGSYWPSAFSREVWEYNVMLAIEGVEEMGFNEIQFDYVRFPDHIFYHQDNIDFRNYENESMAQAINRFLLYARDEMHDRGKYISADVFGETSNDYVCAYGQYWPMMSNIVDVMSAMPYPDHFAKNDYGIYPATWVHPGLLFQNWGYYVNERQAETKNPANVRTWLQGYDTSKDPATVYDVTKINEQIDALYACGLNGGYMVWNAPSELWRYYAYASAFVPRIEE